MNRFHLILISIFFALMGCAKKPAPKPAAFKIETAPVPRQDLDKIARDDRIRLQSLAREAFQTCYFPFDQATLSQEAKDKLAAAGSLMKKKPFAFSITIEGHADERGTEEYNLALAEKRARAVLDYLLAYGVDVTGVRIISYGEERPAVQGQEEASWALNRRAEFQVGFD